MSYLLQRLRIRLHWLVAALMALCLVSMAALVGTTNQVLLRDSGHETAQAMFSQVAERNGQKLQDVLDSARNAVQFLASTPVTGVDGAGLLDRVRVQGLLLSTVLAQPQIYSAYIGFGSDEMLQVIGVRDQPHLRAVLQAPLGTYFALRTIERHAEQANVAMETWYFLDARAVRFAQRSAAPARYSPTSRPWYRQARERAGLQLTLPYEMASSHELGVSLAQAMVAGDGVVAVDLVVSGFDQFAKASLGSYQGGVMLVDHEGQLLASYESTAFQDDPTVRMEYVGQSANDFVAAAARLEGAQTSVIQTVLGQEMVYARSPVAVAEGPQLWVTAFAPTTRFVAPLRSLQRELLWVTLGGLLLILPLAYALSHGVGQALKGLLQQALHIEQGDLAGDHAAQSPVVEFDRLYQSQHSMKLAIRERSQALEEAIRQLHCLVDSGKQLSQRRLAEEVAQHTVESACALLGARSAQLWRCDGSDLVLVAESSLPGLPDSAWEQAPRHALHALDDLDDPCVQVVRTRQPLVFGAENRPGGGWPCQQAVARWLQAQEGVGGVEGVEGVESMPPVPQRLVAVPVLVGSKEVEGVLVVLEPGGGQEAVRFAQTLAAQAAIAFENLALEQAQEDFLEALIRLLAGAIDAKSAYTGGHCARVPELARMLAEAASATETGPLADFRFSTPKEWREFYIGTWLHDCGKITTPDFLMDKATKLETVYNRLHEVRMRFEVLWRDAQIACLEAEQAGEERGEARRRCAERQAALQADFAFVAECNLGSEDMAPERLQRLARIAQQSWWRHFDDRLGLSHGEQRHLAAFAARPLPAREQLLADKPEHVVPRPADQAYAHSQRFVLKPPEALYHHGELHNLGIQRGTLTPEDRFKVNEHVIQTLVMLEQLPLPEGLQRIPEYAGTHHETLNGTGYPRGLDASQLSVPARIMAVADIFEALTAGDRPYKPAKTLSEAIALLHRAKCDGEIDGVVFDLFLTSGVYLAYARRFMQPEHIDAVDIAAYLDAQPLIRSSTTPPG